MFIYVHTMKIIIHVHIVLISITVVIVGSIILPLLHYSKTYSACIFSIRLTNLFSVLKDDATHNSHGVLQGLSKTDTVVLLTESQEARGLHL